MRPPDGTGDGGFSRTCPRHDDEGDWQQIGGKVGWDCAKIERKAARTIAEEMEMTEKRACWRNGGAGVFVTGLNECLE